MKNKRNLKSKQLSAIKLLASGIPTYLVAEKLEVSTMTIYRWQRLPEFEVQLQAVATSGLEEIAKKLNSTALIAIETLQEVLCDLSQPIPLRMKAALGVLNIMPGVNSALERGLCHGKSDFNLKDRWSLIGYSSMSNEGTNETITSATI